MSSIPVTHTTEITTKPAPILEKKEEPTVVKAAKPLGKQRKTSGLSIHDFLNKTEEEEENADDVIITQDKLPNNHFTETDIQNFWTDFLKEIKLKNIVLYNAVNSFRILKIDEKTLRVMYPSDSAKTEFDKVSGDFLNSLRRKLNNYVFEIEYKTDRVNLKKEIVTKRTIFEKMVNKNPALKELDNLLKFDLS